MNISIERTEPVTGGPNRTPRNRIEPVFMENDEVEPDAALDGSSSEGWEGSSAPSGRITYHLGGPDGVVPPVRGSGREPGFAGGR